MTTAARSASSLEVTAAPDVMDLHLDSGLDFGDGDIDLDLRSPGRQDDDISVRDAGADADLDVQTASADQDDFMADNEDLIEEDAVTYDDDAVIEAVEGSTYNHGEEQQAPVSVEEDLIDYSDDEEQPTWNDNTNAQNVDDVRAKDEGEQAVVEQPYEAADEAAQHAPVEEYGHDVYHGANTEEGSHESHNDADSSTQPPRLNSEHGSQTERELEHAYTEQQDQQPYAKDDVASQVGQADQSEHIEAKDESQDKVDASNDSQDQVAIRKEAEEDKLDALLHPITVNYDGTELWLFKHHDFDDSGDFLIEDSAFGRQPISNLLDACRTALGSDVSDDMELGFRLDHFHNIELYQDHSSCAFVTLEHVVGLYLQLHSQDGNVNPDSFYMTLLFRPRVSALLNELNKAAADGIGHSGLNNAIAAGETAFNAHFSHQSTEQVYEDWEAGEHQHEAESYGNSGQEEQEQHEEEYDKGYDEDHHETPYEEHGEEHRGQEYKESKANGTPDRHVQSPNVSAPTYQEASVNTTAEAGDSTAVDEAEHASQSLADRSRSNSQSHPKDEDDLIDYSEDEGEENVTQGGQSQANQPSSSSSTVQGDDTSYGQENVPGSTTQADFTGNDEDATYDFQEVDANENFAEHGDYDYSNEGFDNQLYDDAYNDGQDQEDEHELIEAQELEGYPAGFDSLGNDENTNQYDAFEDQPVDDYTTIGVSSLNDGDHVVESTAVDDEFTGADDFLDFGTADTAPDVLSTDQVGGLAEEDEINDNDEDGAVGQALVAATTDAEPVAVSSSGLQDLSPQGQKRTIDEVGNDAGEATDPLDAKRLRV